MHSKRTAVDINKFLAQLRSHPLAWDTIATTSWSTLGKAVGFLIPFFIAAWFGVSGETDAFFFAYGLILFLATIFSPVLESIIVPFIAEARAKHEDVGGFVGKILVMSGIGLLVISTVFLAFIKPVLSIVTRFSSEGLDLVFWILLESAPLIILLVWTSILAGTLNAYKVFRIPALSPAFRAVITLVFIFFFKEIIGIHSIAWGYVVGEIFRLILLFSLLKYLNLFQLKVSFQWDARFVEFFKTSFYPVIGMSLLVFIPIISKTMATWLGSGNVSILEYADRLYTIPITFLSSGFFVTILSHWSARYQIEGEEKLRRDVSVAIKTVIAIGIPLTVSLFLVKDFFVDGVYGYGQFPDEKVNDIANILGFYLLGITPSFITLVYERAFFITKNTKVFLPSALLRIAGTVIFNWIFMQKMGLAGIALSSFFVIGLTSLFMGFVFSRKSVIT